MSFRLDVRAMVDDIRGSVPGSLDLRPHAVTVRVRTWTGARAGVGTFTDVDTRVLNAGFNPKVRELAPRDVAASGGVYVTGDYRIGPITPEYVGGGTAATTLDPATTTTAREVFFLITGPSLPDDGAWFKRVSDDSLRSFRTEVVVRRMAASP